MQFDESGHPYNTKSIFLGVRRENLPKIDENMIGRKLNIPVRFIGQDERLVGIVTQVSMFHDGTLIHLAPQMGGLFNVDPKNPHS